MKNLNSNFNTNTDNNDTWLTPPYILHELGPFDLDPCASNPRPWDTAKKHYTIEDDGLSQPWAGRVWCNPPYGKKTFDWLKKLAAHKSGIALIFARTETLGFHEQIWNKAHSIFFFKGRLYFYDIAGFEGGASNAPSCLISYSAKDSEIIAKSKLEGRLVYL